MCGSRRGELGRLILCSPGAKSGVGTLHLPFALKSKGRNTRAYEPEQHGEIKKERIDGDLSNWCSKERTVLPSQITRPGRTIITPVE